MRLVKKRNFGYVSGWELGWSPVGNPLMTTLCYRVGSVLVDTGLSHLRPEVLRIVAKNPVEAVLLTHYHEDHSGNAAAIQSHRNIPVYGSAQTAGKLSRPYRIFPYQHLMWGATEPVEVASFPGGSENTGSDASEWQPFEINGIRFTPVHTPGHSRDHVSYLVPGFGCLFSGDLYLSSRIKYFRADEKIDDQINSLKKVLALDFDALFCGHHPRPENGKAAIAAKLRYLEDFYGTVAVLARQGMTASGIMKALHLREQTLTKLLCFGNVSMKNMVRSVIRSL